MTEARRSCLLQMATWQVSKSGEVKPSVTTKKKMGAWGGGWGDLHPKESRRWAEQNLVTPGCPWLFCVLEYHPTWDCLGPVLQCIIYLEDMQSCPFHHHQLCRVWIFGVFFLPPITPATSMYNFISLTTVSCVWYSFISSLPFLLSSSSYKESIYFFYFFSLKIDLSRFEKLYSTHI